MRSGHKRVYFCRALTRRGTRCKFTAQPDSGLCMNHALQEAYGETVERLREKARFA